LSLDEKASPGPRRELDSEPKQVSGPIIFQLFPNDILDPLIRA
jgi:hypothetical protein